MGTKWLLVSDYSAISTVLVSLVSYRNVTPDNATLFQMGMNLLAFQVCDAQNNILLCQLMT